MVGDFYTTLTPELLTHLLGVSNDGWCHYVKKEWTLLHGVLSAVEITRNFANDHTLEKHAKIQKVLCLF